MPGEPLRFDGSSDEQLQRLEQLIAGMFEDLARYKIRVRVLRHLSVNGLWDLGCRVLEELKRRYEAAPEDEQRQWLQEFERIVRAIFPEMVSAWEQKPRLIRLGQELLRQVEPLLRKGKRPKVDRNEIIEKLRRDGMDWRSIRQHLLEHYPEMMKVKKTGKIIELESLRSRFGEWLKKQGRQDPFTKCIS
jgi:hypothetical protein